MFSNHTKFGRFSMTISCFKKKASATTTFSVNSKPMACVRLVGRDWAGDRCGDSWHSRFTLATVKNQPAVHQPNRVMVCW